MSESQTADDGEAQLTNLTRRRALQTAAVVGATAAVGGMPAAAATPDFGDETLDYASDYAHNPYIPATITVETHKPEFEELDYIDDNGDQRSLQADGYVTAENRDTSTPHNPVSLNASNFETGEYTDFPRGVKYDSDGDGDVDSDDDDVRVVDATHWVKDASGTAGTASISDGGDDNVVISASGQASGDTAIFTFDLSAVGGSDATITDGMSRRFLQLVSDITTLASGVTVEFAVRDSAGTEVVATYDPAGDTSTTKVLANATGDGKARQVRVGELESAQSVTLDDIQVLEVRINDADAEFTLQGANLERSSKWEYGTQEYLNSDSEVDTQTVYEPSGSYSITGIGTLDTAFDGATIHKKTLDVEQQAAHLPDHMQHATLNDLSDAYSYPQELEHLYEFESVSAYELSVTHNSLEDVERFPGSRYLTVEAATGVSDLESWDDADNVSWTDRTDRYSAVDDQITLLSSVNAADRTVVRHRVQVRDSEAGDVTSSGGAAAAASSGGSVFVNAKTVLLGLLGGGLVFFRKKIMALFG